MKRTGVFHDGVGLTGLGLFIYLVFWGAVLGAALYVILPLADHAAQQAKPIVDNYWSK